MRPAHGGGEVGRLALVLHAHLPYVRHPEHESFLEEDWYYEGLTETYLPLLEMLHRLRDEGVPFQLTLTLTPPLLAMMADPLLGARYGRRLESLVELSQREIRRTRSDPDPRMRRVARHYHGRLAEVRHTWERWGGQPIRGFRDLADSDHLDILTSGATHGYLPLLRVVPEAVRAQLAVGAQAFHHLVGRRPRGIWLPECGYYPGLDEVVAGEGLSYFVLESQGILFADPRPRAGTLAPILCPGSGVAGFGRDPETAHQVWSREQGYPGDPVYREFYRDIGYDLDIETIGPWVQPGGGRKNTGFKYHRITGPGEEKDIYDPGAARERAGVHAANFMFNRERQIEHHARWLGQPPLVVAPYDAELFGHWWYEGPWFLESLIRRVPREQSVFRLVHLGGYLREAPSHQVARPAESSWGDQGHHGFWLDEPNAWVYAHLHRAARAMVDLAARHPDARGLVRRALDQAARELLLAQSSDWAFLMRAGTAPEYALRRTESHLRRFFRLDEEIQRGEIDPEWLGEVEAVDPIFELLDYRVFAPGPRDDLAPEIGASPDLQTEAE